MRQDIARTLHCATIASELQHEGTAVARRPKTSAPRGYTGLQLLNELGAWGSARWLTGGLSWGQTAQSEGARAVAARATSVVDLPSYDIIPHALRPSRVDGEGVEVCGEG